MLEEKKEVEVFQYYSKGFILGLPYLTVFNVVRAYAVFSVLMCLYFRWEEMCSFIPTRTGRLLLYDDDESVCNLCVSCL